MSRSGYVDDGDLDPLELGRWRAQVASSIRGKRGQQFLRELADAMDAMPVKELIASALINSEGACCTIGVVCKSRGLDVSNVDVTDPESVGNVVGISRQLAAEIEYLNDECPDFRKDPETGEWKWDETPAERWARMRKWVNGKIKENVKLQASG
jgi:hypothetical protein